MPENPQAPFHLVLISANTWDRPYQVYPLGISYLASHLARTLPAIRVTLLDVNTDPAAIQDLEELSPDLVGVSLRNVDSADSMNPQSFIAGYARLLDQVRQQTAAPIVVGGAGFSIFPERIMEQLQADYGVAGEGESALQQLIEAMLQDEPATHIAGLWHRSGNQLVQNQRGASAITPSLQLEDRLVPHYWSQSGMLNIQTKRGCPFRCVYCSYPIVDGNTVRTLDPDQIVHTLQKQYHRHGIDYVFFTDSVFNIDPTFNQELCERLAAMAAPVRWGAYFSPYRLTGDQLELYQRAGLQHIEFGTESLDDNTLKAYRKPFDFAAVQAVSDLCHERKINYAHFMILGGIGETEQSLANTLQLSEQLRGTVFFPFFGMRIYPRTGLHKIVVDEGVISASDNLLEPRYYLNPDLDYNAFKVRAAAARVRWVMPDEPESPAIAQLRARGRRGPLWEYLVRG